MQNPRFVASEHHRFIEHRLKQIRQNRPLQIQGCGHANATVTFTSVTLRMLRNGLDEIYNNEDDTDIRAVLQSCRVVQFLWIVYVEVEQEDDCVVIRE